MSAGKAVRYMLEHWDGLAACVKVIVAVRRFDRPHGEANLVGWWN